MRKSLALVLACLFLLLAVACGTGKEEPPEDSGVYYKIVEWQETFAHVVEWSDREHQLGICSMSWVDDVSVLDENGEPITVAELRAGMVLELEWDGMVQESYPGGIRGVTAIRVVEQDNDFVGLFRAVVQELWETEPSLNADIAHIGFDFSALTNLSDKERNALKYLVSCDLDLGLDVDSVNGAYIDRKDLYWEDGVLLSIELTEQTEDRLVFTAQKWRGVESAVWLTDCVAVRGESGTWSWEVGGAADS